MNEIKLSDWLTCKKELIELGFTEEEIEKALKDIEYTIETLTDSKNFEHEPTYCNPRLLIKTKTSFNKKVYNGEWEKEVRTSGSEWRIKAHYQGLKHSKLIFQLFKNRYEWFDSFKKDVIEKVKPTINNWTKVKDIPEEYRTMTLQELIELEPPKDIVIKKSLWEIYELYRSDSDIYLETKLGTLYVPITAILNKNWNIIKERHTEYHKKYYNTPDRKEYLDKSLKILKSKEAKQLKNFLK